ncbi:MAG: LacI family DNA-binding transcriptional regulator [bacterium]|nr:LacI family DNA-binding transcriptional regulator [bacterium]
MKRTRSRKGAHGIVDVALRAGVSPATVSRFYNHPDIVSTPTRIQIEKAAADLGYIRNRLAGSLHNLFSGTIGLIVPTIDNAIFAEFIEAFASHLRIQDRTTLIASHGYDLSLEVQIVRSLLERRIDGVVLVGFDHDLVALSMLADRNVSIISVWNYREDESISSIGASNTEAAKLITGHIIDLGHRDICFIFPDTKFNDRARDRKQAALQTAYATGLTVPKNRLWNCPYDIGEAKILAQKILSKNRPTAIVCGNDIIAHGVIYAAQSLGFDLPDDLSVGGIGDFRGSGDMEPGLTTVRLPARQIGHLAADAIVEMSQAGLPPKPSHRLVEISLIRRGSTKRIQNA